LDYVNPYSLNHLAVHPAIPQTTDPKAPFFAYANKTGTDTYFSLQEVGNRVGIKLNKVINKIKQST
jgi:hypothetical protein